MNKYQKMKDQLETLIDENGLRTLLVALSEVCGEKEQHVATNWQDHALAKAWRKRELMIDRCANNIPDCGDQAA